MPRIPRGQTAGYAYHIINRGNGRSAIFHKAQDYDSFLELLALAKRRHAVKILAFCLMPNHFHLVIEPGDPSALSKFMQWLLTSHVRRYHRHYHSSGHVWQGRFKSFPVQRDEHLVTVLRYVAQNPVRAGLASSPAEWIWSSAKRKDLVDPLLIDVPPDLDIPLSSDELDRLHESVSRQRPYGSPSWQEEIAKKLGLLVSMRPRGRPKTVNK